MLPEQEGTLPLISAGLTTREFSGHTVITLRGELDAADAPRLTAEFTAARNPQIIADLGALRTSTNIEVRCLRGHEPV